MSRPPFSAGAGSGSLAVREQFSAGDYAAAREGARRLVSSARAQQDDPLLAEALELLSFAESRCGDALHGLAIGLEGATLAARDLNARQEVSPWSATTGGTSPRASR